MVASPNADFGGDAPVNFLLGLKRQVDELGRQTKYPLLVSHGGTTDFSLTPSPSGDGTTDVYIGNGVGGALLQVMNDPVYGTKIMSLLDYNGTTMMSTDASAGYGLGVPSYPFLYAGFESLNMSGATSVGTATEIGRGQNFVYNPALFVEPRIRISSVSAVTVNIFAQFVGLNLGTVNTTERVFNVNGVQVQNPDFMCLFPKEDMNNNGKVFIKAYCSAGIGADVSMTVSYNLGYGVSKALYDQSISTH